MKRIALILAISILLCFAGCGAEPSSSDDVIEGGYTINTVAGKLPEDAENAFSAVGTGKALSLLGQQLVSGTNYFILAEDDGALKVEKIYASFSGTYELLDTYDFDLSSYTSQTIDIINPNIEDGAAFVPDDVGSGLTSMPQELATATSAAFLDFSECKFTALAQVATQVVAGTNYALVCSGKTADDASPCIYLVIVYAGVDGTFSVVGAHPIDVSTFN